MKIGYARVSTEDQNMNLQIDALRAAGCAHIFTDFGVSGKGFDRPGLTEALDAVSAGSSLVVWRLDRLGRSLPKLIELVDNLGQRGAEFQSLTEHIDTSSSGGRLVFHIIGALAEFERSLISERTKAGMAAARARGQHVGRRPALTPGDVADARRAVAQGRSTMEIAGDLGVSQRTLRRYLNIIPS
ncbi:UNVERIFIED_ORG: DNA invertase Pin-like site-specific DNA recombinase [Martelella mediterranea]